MKIFTALFTLLFFTPQTFANECSVHSVVSLEGFSEGLKPHIEQLMIKKGYKIIQGGFLYEDYNVPVSQLKIKEDLVQSGGLLAISAGPLAYDTASICTKWISGMLTCEFNFSLYKISEKGELMNIVKINETLKKKPSFFQNEDKIVKKYIKNIMTRAENEIPLCK